MWNRAPNPLHNRKVQHTVTVEVKARFPDRPVAGGPQRHVVRIRTNRRLLLSNDRLARDHINLPFSASAGFLAFLRIIATFINPITWAMASFEYASPLGSRNVILTGILVRLAPAAWLRAVSALLNRLPPRFARRRDDGVGIC